MKKLSVAVIISSVGKTPEALTSSFIFDEAYRLARSGLTIHTIRAFQEESSFSHGIHFHGLEKTPRIKYLPFLFKYLNALPALGYLIPPWKLLYLSKYANAVIDVAKSKNIELFHAHFAYPEGFVGLLAKRVVGKPLVVTLHGHDILTMPSVDYGTRLKRRFNSVIVKVLKEASVILAPSSAIYSEALRAGASKDRLSLVPNGVDLQRFAPNIDGSIVRERLGLKEKFMVFLLRTHSPKYGIEYLIRAIPIVLSQNKQIQFVIGGDGSLKSYHENLVSKLGVKENVTFTGRISAEALPQYYAAANVVVVPSLQEGFGLAVTEAMASERPVIGSKVGGIPDQIIDGKTGFLVQPSNSTAIAKKIDYLVNHPAEAKQMGITGRKIAEAKFNINHRIQEIIKIYGTLLSRS